MDEPTEDLSAVSHHTGEQTTAYKNLCETPQSCDKTEGHLKLIIPCCKRQQLGKAVTRRPGFLLYRKLVEKSISEITVCLQYWDRVIPRSNQGSTVMKRFTEQSNNLYSCSQKDIFFKQKNPQQQNKMFNKLGKKVPMFAISKLRGDTLWE